MEDISPRLPTDGRLADQRSTVTITSVAVVLGLLCALWVAALYAHAPSSPKGVDAPRDEFSAYRAMGILRSLQAENVPHPLGSAANAAVRERILQQLRQLGYKPEVQSGILGCDHAAVCGTPANIVARIGGTENEDSSSVLLVAHYDSVPAGPGASDDGAGVASVLEIARALTAAPRTRHSVIFLFDDGEELGSLGTQEFLEHHRWAKSIKAAVNVDNRGTTGSSFLWETGTASAWLMDLYAKAIVRPNANSFAEAMFEMMPQRTDFSDLKAAGAQGYNFAYIGGIENYHTSRDTIERADPSSMQQQGGNALSIVRTLANSSIDHPANDKSEYFDVFGRILLRFPLRLMMVATIITIVFALIIAASLIRRRLIKTSELVWALPAVIIAPLAGAFASVLLTLLLKAVARQGVPDFSPYPWVFHLILVSLSFAIIVLMSIGLRRHTSFRGFWCANALWMAILAGVLALALPGGNYVALLPAIVAVGVLGLPIRMGDGRARREGAVILYLSFMFALVWPLLIPVYESLGTDSLPPFAAVLVLASAPIAGLLLEAAPRMTTRLAGIAAVLVLIGCVAAAVVPAYTDDVPERLNIRYEADSAAPPRWVIVPSSGHLPEEFLRVAKFKVVTTEPDYPLLATGTLPVFEAIAPDLRQSAPSFKILSAVGLRQTSQPVQGAHYRAQVRSLRGAPTLTIAFAPAAKIQSLWIRPTDGLNAPPVVAKLRAAVKGWRTLTLVGLPPQGMELVFDASTSPFEVALLDKSYGLPNTEQSPWRARPNTTVASQDGDVTLVTSVYKLGPQDQAELPVD